ncbi:integrase [Falsochrobactrum shanghaiense]|uniref:Integrase n=2 Tax=Falsochrobactrum shanghaiense TaxID=2201899 RepID=A0A316JC91_9HYPH|nr:integrase [Falsochrobactrum shanghaiense]
MTKRNEYESADDALWAMLKAGADGDKARALYDAAIKRADAIGISYVSADRLLSFTDEALAAHLTHRRDSVDENTAVYGAAGVPSVSVTQALRIYFDEITPDELTGKSEIQKKRWRAHKQRAIDHFVKIVSDKAIADITREDAQKFYKVWLQKITRPEKNQAVISASMGNRMMGGMRVLFAEYFKHMGDRDRPNPFRDLSFAEKVEKSRPPIPTDIIQAKFLTYGPLVSLNQEARGIVLAMIETGCRPSELCNITAEHIFLADKVPHILIAPRKDAADPREIKTASSIRKLPLVGIAHEVFKRHRNGFPRYKNKEDTLSATLNKYFKDNELFPKGAGYTVYSLRHSFEDRMKEAGLDDELRRMLMGHTVDRPRYGMGGSLEWRKEQMEKFTLPFDAAVI